MIGKNTNKAGNTSFAVRGLSDENIPTTSLLMKRFLMKACIGDPKSRF